MEKFVGIHSVNSVDFVRTAFDVYSSGDVLVVMKEGGCGLPLQREIAPMAGGGWLDVRQDVIRDDRPAQIVFSSGTEGTPKAILLTHRALADVVTRLNDTMKVDATIREYVGVPVTYSFGLGRCRAVAAAGGRCFIPSQGFNPAEIARLLAADEINAISAVPTLWRTLLVRPEIIGDLGRRVNWIEIGSQFMSRTEKEQMKRLFPNARIVQHYGLTEASRTALLVISDTAGERLDSVGRAVGNVEIKISDAGLIMIRGPHVAAGQLVDGEIRRITDSDGWLTTSDLGRMEDGYLYYEGRADDVINCGGIKVNPELLQERINARLGDRNRIAVSRIDDALRGDAFFVAIESNAGIDLQAVEKISVDELQGLGIDAKSAVKVQQVSSIPRTDTGKVRRKELSRLYAPAKLERPAVASLDEASSVRDLFAHEFPGMTIRDEDTFRSLGGDSLNYVQMLMLLEKHLGFAPPDWDKASVAQLERVERVRVRPRFSWMDTSIFLRAAAILGVVVTHSGKDAVGGGTWLLFMLIGFNLARFKSADFFRGEIWSWFGGYFAAIVVPYVFFALFYFAWNKTIYLDLLLFYTNLVEARITVVFPFWFIQVLLQCLIVIGAMFSVSFVRNFATKSALKFSVVVMLLAIAVRAAYPFVWDTDSLNDLVPTRFLAIIWLGWCAYFVSGTSQRLVLCAVGIAFAILDAGYSSKALWLMIGSVFLTLVPRVPVPLFVRRPINDVAAATFVIFALNGLFIFLFSRVLPDAPFLLTVLVGTLGPMLVWWLAERYSLGEWISVLASSRRSRE